MTPVKLAEAITSHLRSMGADVTGEIDGPSPIEFQAEFDDGFDGYLITVQPLT